MPQVPNGLFPRGRPHSSEATAGDPTSGRPQDAVPFVQRVFFWDNSDPMTDFRRLGGVLWPLALSLSAAPAWAQVNLANGVTGTLPVANGGTGVATGFQALLTATVTLTDAQIKALPTTAIEIVAAPAANTRIKPVSATLQVSVVTATYTNINATYAQLSLGWDGSTFPWAVVPVVNDSTTTPAMTRVTDLLGGAVHDSIVDLTVPYSEMSGADWWLTQPAVNVSFTTTVAKNFTISLDNNGSGNLTGGNAANTMRVVLVYYVEATV